MGGAAQAAPLLFAARCATYWPPRLYRVSFAGLSGDGMKNTIRYTLALLALALALSLPQFARAEESQEGSAGIDDLWTIFPPAPADAESTDNASWLTPAG